MANCTCLVNASERHCEQCSLCSWPAVPFICHLVSQDVMLHVFKLHVFIFSSQAWQAGSAYWRDDTGCLFFAVKKSRGVVNISWYSDELKKTPTTYRNKFPETEIVACQALMWGFVLACPVQLYFACLGPDSVTQLDSIRNGNGWETRGGNRNVLLWPLNKLCPNTVVRVAAQFSSRRWTCCARCHFCHPVSTVIHSQALGNMELLLCLVFP